MSHGAFALLNPEDSWNYPGEPLSGFGTFPLGLAWRGTSVHHGGQFSTPIFELQALPLFQVVPSSFDLTA